MRVHSLRQLLEAEARILRDLKWTSTAGMHLPFREGVLACARNRASKIGLVDYVLGAGLLNRVDG